ncbi:aldo/keto reductase family domain-containing protein [Ditylenchus destructor]|nr:aldo/keto reductase family domain-containing protein [Ditylenchus destructor]
MSTSVPSIVLSNGLKMPIIGLGTWQSQPEEIELAVRTALDVGYRHIDTAKVYANEADIGNTLVAYYANGKVKREDLFITTKLWCTHNRPEDIEEEIRNSCVALKTDYVDLYLAHMPVAFNHDMSQQDHTVKVEDIWKGLEAVYEKGLAKSIGVSNFNAEQIERIMKVAKVPIHNLQVELHLNFAQFELQEVCKKHNISLCAYAPLGSPGRVNVKPPPGVKLTWPESLEPLKSEVVLRLADKYKKTPAQVLLRHLIQRDIVVIPKSINPERIKENFQVFDFKLTSDEVLELNKQPQVQRLFLQDFMEGHPEDPFKSDRK